MYKIMLLDDEENILKSLTRTLRQFKDWDIETYSSPADAIKRARCCIFDVVISDYNMPDINGIEFLTELKTLQPDAMRILLTGCVEIDVLLDALNIANVFRFITKPWNDGALIETIQDALKYRDIIHENKILAAQVREQRNELINMKNVSHSYVAYSNFHNSSAHQE